MKKKNSALKRSLLIVAFLAVSSYFVLEVFNRMTNPDLDISINTSGIGQAVLDVVVDVLRSLINPERRS
ncbi:MAG: hypothetical protein RIF46_01140 [Cyclobacteriaceae bacterium]